jgi:hypothetical protein
MSGYQTPIKLVPSTTIRMTAANAAPTAVSCGSGSQFVIANNDVSNQVYWGWGTTAAAALTAATVPVAAGAAGGYQQGPGQKESITVDFATANAGGNVFFTAITDTAGKTADCYVTPGIGA